MCEYKVKLIIITIIVNPQATDSHEERTYKISSTHITGKFND